MGPNGTPLKVVKVEDTSDWAAVAAIDRGDGDAGGAGGAAGGGGVALAPAVAAGDLLALLAFAAVGRASHGEPLDVGAVVDTAGPFVAAWFTAASLLGGYGADARPTAGAVGASALAAAKVWAVGVPLGIALRSLARGYAPPAVFVGVTMAVTLVVMVGWRAAYAAALGVGGGKGAEDGGSPRTPQQRLDARKDKRGGPLELLQVIMSLTKRW
jgi:hypothetical protein